MIPEPMRSIAHTIAWVGAGVIVAQLIAILWHPFAAALSVALTVASPTP